MPATVVTEKGTHHHSLASVSSTVTAPGDKDEVIQGPTPGAVADLACGTASAASAPVTPVNKTDQKPPVLPTTCLTETTPNELLLRMDSPFHDRQEWLQPAFTALGEKNQQHMRRSSFGPEDQPCLPSHIVHDRHKWLESTFQQQREEREEGKHKLRSSSGNSNQAFGSFLQKRENCKSSPVKERQKWLESAFKDGENDSDCRNGDLCLEKGENPLSICDSPVKDKKKWLQSAFKEEKTAPSTPSLNLSSQGRDKIVVEQSKIRDRQKWLQSAFESPSKFSNSDEAFREEGNNVNIGASTSCKSPIKAKKEWLQSVFEKEKAASSNDSFRISPQGKAKAVEQSAILERQQWLQSAFESTSKCSNKNCVFLDEGNSFEAGASRSSPQRPSERLQRLRTSSDGSKDESRDDSREKPRDASAAAKSSVEQDSTNHRDGHTGSQGNKPDRSPKSHSRLQGSASFPPDTKATAATTLTGLRAISINAEQLEEGDPKRWERSEILATEQANKQKRNNVAAAKKMAANNAHTNDINLVGSMEAGACSRTCISPSTIPLHGQGKEDGLCANSCFIGLQWVPSFLRSMFRKHSAVTDFYAGSVDKNPRTADSTETPSSCADPCAGSAGKSWFKGRQEWLESVFSSEAQQPSQERHGNRDDKLVPSISPVKQRQQWLQSLIEKQQFNGNESKSKTIEAHRLVCQSQIKDRHEWLQSVFRQERQQLSVDLASCSVDKREILARKQWLQSVIENHRKVAFRDDNVGHQDSAFQPKQCCS